MEVAITALIGFITAIVVAEIFLTAKALTIQQNAIQKIERNKTRRIFTISQENSHGLSKIPA